MNVIEKYDVVLTQLTSADLELVRHWRNSSFVKEGMQFQEEITPTNQIRWFSKLDEAKNYYFIIHYKGQKVGVVNIKDIEEGIGEAGIFIGEVKYLNTTVSYAATITLMEFAFDTLGLYKLLAKIRSDNHKVILFNQSLGYEWKGMHEGGFTYYEVSREQFMNAASKLKKVLEKLK